MILPTIHMNGTGIETLEEGYAEASAKLCEAQEAFGDIEFNSRDYYPQGPDAWTQAVKQRDEAAKNLQAVFDYLLLHREHICDVMAEREARKAQ